MIRKVTSVVAHVVHGVLTGSYRYTRLREVTSNLDAFTRIQSKALATGGTKKLDYSAPLKETMRLRPRAPFEERRTVVVGMATVDNGGLRGYCENPVSDTGGS